MNATPNQSADLQQRIERFEHMASADPDNEMAHFSLGSAYSQAARHAEAAQSFERCMAINPEMSKAYQLAGQALIEAGEEEKAADILERGVHIAASKGDLMPKNGMIELLRSIGKEAPETSPEQEEAAASMQASGGFLCSRTGRNGTQMDAPPFRGPIGEWIQTNIAQETWKDWIDQGTKVINELRLDLSREPDQESYDQHMYEFLGLDDATVKSLTN
jgi:Fe-S cluster biosynthesis and repair protein YggX